MVSRGTSSFLPDRFDDVEADRSYVGSHRRTRSSLSLFAPVGIALGAVVVLVLAGLWFVDQSGERLALEDTSAPVIDGAPNPDSAPAPTLEEPTPDVEAAPVTDPGSIDTAGLTLTLLNGTAAQGMAARAGARLTAIGWPEPTAANADSTDIAQSVVAYSDDADRAIALGIAGVLGIDAGAVVQTSAYPGARVTVVLGADYRDTEST